MNDNDFVRNDLYQKDLDLIANELDNTNKRIDDVKDSIGHNLALTAILVGVFQLGLALILYFLTKH